jgi:hypothetical protein
MRTVPGFHAAPTHVDSRFRSRTGLAMPRLPWLCMHAELAVSYAWLRPHAFALVQAWLRLASHGCVCMLSSLSLMHGSGLTPSLSYRLGCASPPMAVYAC